MHEFYKWPSFIFPLITLYFVMCVLSQALAAILSFLCRRGSHRQVFECLLELSILAHLFAVSALYAQIRQSFEALLISPPGYGGLRIVGFAVVALSAVATAASARKPHPLFDAVVAGLTLPVFEQMTGASFAYVYLAAVSYWLVRGIRCCALYYGEIRAGLSALSIKNAIDSMHTAVMFCEEDGFVLLSNTQMQTVMVAITGKAHRNGRHFYGLLTLGKIKAGCKMAWFEGQSLCLLPDGSAWKFDVTELSIGRKNYFQLTAADISDIWNLTASLEPRRGELALRREQLNETIENLHTVVREIETQRAKMRAHDILGERLTILLSAIRCRQDLNYPLLKSLSQSLIDELKAAQSAPSPSDELNSIIRAFGAVGVDVQVNGNIPEGGSKGQCIPEGGVKGQCIVEIVREAVANAVRHGFASQVYVKIVKGAAKSAAEEDASADADTVYMRITDNGYPPSGMITEGGGISGMRKKAELLGGTVAVAISPQFTLTVEL